MSLPALILAGGFGTRLSSVLPGLPKLLAPVNGRPFIRYVLDRLERAGVTDVVLCTGHRAEQIRDEFARCPANLEMKFSHETLPLGTGGAIRQALKVANAQSFLVLNGDSFVDCDLGEFVDWHRGRDFPGSLVLTYVNDTSRFGTVITGERGAIEAFREKEGKQAPGWINAGVYVLSRELFEPLADGQAYSLEKDLFPQWLRYGLGGYRIKAPFIDIGTPESLLEAPGFLAHVGHAP